VLFLFSCGNNKKEADKPKTEPVSLIADTTFQVQVDTVTVIKEEPEPPVLVNEYFDDFIYHFASDDNFQLKRVVFPLPYYDKDTPLKIEKNEWKHDSLFVGMNYYTLFFDSEEDIEMLGDTSRSSVQLEWVYMKPHLVKKYYFERIKGKWMLEALNQYPLQEAKKADFIDFFIKFSTDSVYQAEHLRNPLEFVTTDPDDDFAILETILDHNQWFAFRPELPDENFININYGQKNEDSSSTKIVYLKGIGNGFLNTLFFKKKHGKWGLYKFEDTSN